MKRSAALLIFVGLAVGVRVIFAEDNSKPESSVASATVLSDSCRFSFPIENIEREWKWGISPANVCEYSWMVTVRSGADTFQLGFSYFNPDAIAESGTLSELLKAGQTNGWRLVRDGESASYVDGLRVRPTIDGNQLQFVVADKAWTQRLFNDKPQVVRFETRGTQLKRSAHNIRVEYKLESKSIDK